MAVVDCGIPINPALARIQAEGGIVQGIGHTLMEDIQYDRWGKPIQSSFLQYGCPRGWTWAICGWNLSTAMSPPVPFGAKSIGENRHQHPRPRPDPRHLPGHRGVASGDPPSPPSRLPWGWRHSAEKRIRKPKDPPKPGTKASLAFSLPERRRTCCIFHRAPGGYLAIQPEPATMEPYHHPPACKEGTVCIRSQTLPTTTTSRSSTLWGPSRSSSTSAT